MRHPFRMWTWWQKGIQAAVLFLVMLGAAPSLDAAEGKRVALVVGIGAYEKLPVDKQLKNPVNDAEGVSAKLSAVGFRVTKAVNPTRSAFNEKWQNVLDSLGKDDTFVLFFSGHGVQIDGQNYLLPQDIPYIEYGRQEQLKREAISLNELLADLSTGDRLHPRTSVVILDACRDNPLIPSGFGNKKSVSMARGLAGLPESDGIFVMYAAASSRTALDRLTPSDPATYSVFTRTLLPLIGRTDLSIQELGTELKNQVWELARTAGQEQRPTYYDGIVGRFCLPGCEAKAEKEPVGLKESLATVVYPAPSKEITGKDGAPMVLIPAGQFTMGSPDGEGAEDEHPRHQIYLDPYYMDKFEVTVARYAKFMRAKNNPKPKDWDQADSSRHRSLPVVGVDWHDATGYCEWAGKRLPTEAEWEKAARGTDGRTYPWGNEQPTARLANFGKNRFWTNVYDEGVASVDTYEVGNSPYGLHHMAGNVLEWVADWYDGHYYSKSPEQNPVGPSNGGFRVVRGGAWYYGPVRVRSVNRDMFFPTDRLVTIGFRCAQDIPRSQNQRTTSVMDREIRPQPTTDSAQMITSQDGAPMVLIPAGEFMMGSREDMAGDKDELPAHPVYLDAYYIDQYEVTTMHYAKFVQEAKRDVPEYWPTLTYKLHEKKPVIGVTWDDAVGYCAWAGKRLPTEAEWEKAARGTDQRKYPWGNEVPDRTRANFDRTMMFTVYGVLVDVGSLEVGKSPYGAYDMAGNASEWVSDWYGQDYYMNSPSRNPKGPASGQKRVIRGGFWNDHSGAWNDYKGVASVTRGSTSSRSTGPALGFRCAQDASN